MPQEEKEYAIVKEADEIIKSLRDRYQPVLWPVIPEEIIVLGVTNKERPERQTKLAQVRRVTGAMKALLEEFRVNKKYIVELYYSDWNVWAPPRRQWVLFHELIHIPAPHEKGLIKHDVQDFSGIIDYFGNSHWYGMESLPDMLAGDPIKFDEAKFHALHIKEDDSGEDEE